jgi:hypothetical protein
MRFFKIFSTDFYNIITIFFLQILMLKNLLLGSSIECKCFDTTSGPGIAGAINHPICGHHLFCVILFVI